MRMITLCQLSQIAKTASQARLSGFIEPLNNAMIRHAINTPLRCAAFIATSSYESGDFFVMREMTSGMEYEYRADLGNTEAGDGARYRGRGILQIKGRENYELCGEGLGLDLINHPDLMEYRPHSSDSAAWYWAELKNLNQLADKEDLITITKRLTGGYYSGLAMRVIYFDRAKRALGLEV